MKQVIRRGLKEIIVEEVPDPVPSSNHVVVAPRASLISSGTETASIKTDLVKEVADNPSHIQKILNVMKMMGPVPTIREVMAKFSEYAVLGYSGAGVVVAKHHSVTDLALGERVAYGGEGTGHGEALLVGRNLAARIPEGVGYDEASFATLGAIAMNSIRVAAPGLGDSVAVIGLGLVGQLCVQLAKAQGAVVCATDLRADRVELAKKLGADYGMSEGTREALLAVTGGRGADVVIIAAAAKSAAPCQLAIDLCRDRGKIVVVGAVQMAFDWYQAYMKEMQVLFSRAYGPGSYDAQYEKRGIDYPVSYVRWTENRNMEEFLRLIAKKRVDVKSLITHRYALGDAPEAYRTIMTPGTSSLAVVLDYPAAKSEETAYIPKRKVEIAVKPIEKGVLQGALLGAGNLARWAHLPNLKASKKGELRAIFSTSGARGMSYGNRFGAAYAASDLQQILEDKEIDFALIVSRNAEHAPQTIAALNAGKHVFVEKPMALSIEECREIEEAVKRSGKTLSVGFNRRFSPYYVPMKEKLARRGNPVTVNVRMNSPGISGAYWMADPSIGGAVLGEAVHFIDLMYWLLDAEPVTVYSRSLPVKGAGTIGENNLATTIDFADGSIATFNYSTIGSGSSGGERVEVFSEGLGLFSEDFKKLTVATGRRSETSSYFAKKGYEALLEDFLAAAQAGRQPSVGVRDGSRATVVALKMLESARTGQPMAIDLDRELAPMGSLVEAEFVS